MPKIAKSLSPLAVSKLKHPGNKAGAHYVAVGTVPGLILQITPSGAKSWILRTRVGAQRREIGLGAYPSVSLAMAHDAARAMKETIRAGIDPVAERRNARAELVMQQVHQLTFATGVERFLETPYMQDQTDRQRGFWQSTLATYSVPIIGQMAISDISTSDVKAVLEPIWNEKRETARRVRSRMEAVFGWAIDKGHRTGENPATLSVLQQWIKNYSAPNAGKKSNRDALAITDAPAWFAELQKLGGIESQALQFAALTAARSGEVREATWSEIDLEARTWTIAAERMKMKREHVVPLSDAALALLKAVPRFEGNDVVFVGRRGGFFNQNALSNLMKEMNDNREGGWLDKNSGKPATPHGLRSTFKDWAIEKTEYPSDMSEIALAHKVGNTVEQAYRRGGMLEKRRAMMQDWASFLSQ